MIVNICNIFVNFFIYKLFIRFVRYLHDYYKIINKS